MCICVSHWQVAQEILSVNILSETERDLSKKWLMSITLYRWVSSGPSGCEAGCSQEPQPLPLSCSPENAPRGEGTTTTLSPLVAGASVWIHSGTCGGRAAFGSPCCDGALPLARRSPSSGTPSWVIRSPCCYFSPGSVFTWDKRQGDNFMPLSLHQNTALI